MVRKIIQIDEDKCIGCGLCAEACHEGAIAMVNGKARLMREDYCDGLGDCLPSCPAGAITFVEREAPAYDAAAVAAARVLAASQGLQPDPAAGNCPGTAAAPVEGKAGMLANWPVQLKLAPVKAPYFDGARLLIAADCAAYTYAGFHERFIKGRMVVIGCPKLDGVDYSEKLGEIIRGNDIRGVTVVRMEVPCCGGLENAARTALQKSGKFIPWQVVTLSTEGDILDE